YFIICCCYHGFQCVSPYKTFNENPVTSSPFYDVFLGGSCGNTVWRKEEVIPFLEKRGITYFDPQKCVWDQNMIGEEDVAKENSRLILFVIDPTTINATSYLEIAHIAARQVPKMVVVFLNQMLWQENGLPEDRVDRKRVCETLGEILSMHHIPVLHTIKEALIYIDEAILDQKSWSEAMTNPLQRLPFLMLKGRRVFQQSAHKINTNANATKKSWKVKFEKDPSPEGKRRMNAISSARHIIYYFPTAESMLSGMVEVAYIFGRISWKLTICLPPEDRRCIKTNSKDAVLREEYRYRNSCYKTAFLYLQAMGKDKNCQVMQKACAV
uniref:TIR domain-containing protein n=1 Tax=Syphacia muris TaxID=451379 RepID=A0A0N5ABM1_9BILA